MKRNFLRLYINTGILIAALFIYAGASFAQVEKSNSAYSNINLDTVKAGKFDTGKMWTFEFPPKQYFKDEYKFNASDEWLDNVRMSALRFATYCSASFVSSDGLVMTNHHCARESVTKASKEGEDLHTHGFYAEKLQDERKIDGLFVDQLVKIIDVTDQIKTAVDAAKDEKDKKAERDSAITKIQNKYKTETGLECSVVTLFNGGKYSLYCYKRYNDVRLVFAPETDLGFFGGDPDNFTYPRYALDCSFFRVYGEDGKPLKTDHYFKWSPAGATEGEPVFVVGNPGRTNRLQTVAQLEYQRDISNPIVLDRLSGLMQIYSDLMKEEPSRVARMQDMLFSYSNSQKAYTGIQKGLLDPILMQRKKAFEQEFKTAVKNNPKLSDAFGNLWQSIAETRSEMRKIGVEQAMIAFDPRFCTAYTLMAQELLKVAEQVKLPESERKEEYKDENLSKIADKLFSDKLDYKLADRVYKMQLQLIEKYLGKDNEYYKIITNGKDIDVAYNEFVKNSPLRNKEAFTELIKKGADAILSCNDPLFKFIRSSKEKAAANSKHMKEIIAKESVVMESLGRALFEVYGTSIPPDATFSLRIADGVVKGYEYNGTEAPVNTTFYGLYDRYYSFGKKYPFSLPERWQNPPKDFRLETPMVFVATNDIIGGNSGSPVINEKAEIVGLAFDGNIESLPGQFIFTTEANRTVAVHSAGMMEALKHIYRAERLGEELKDGKIN